MNDAPRYQLLTERAVDHGDATAVIDPGGQASYRELLVASRRVASGLLAGTAALAPERVAFLLPPGRDHVRVQWGIWRAGAIAVPLAASHPERELAYVLDDATPAAVVTDLQHAPRLEGIVRARGIQLLDARALAEAEPRALPAVTAGQPALMVYTSGTTGRPKGAVTTHANLHAQIAALVAAWEWCPGDRILHVLPLHHVHGIVNALCCALWAGAACEFLPRFDPVPTWERLSSGDITLFMAVPTIYGRLIAAWEAADRATRARWSGGSASLRLMVSGSAALPVAMLARWREITGHTLLERYGMTEIGMALSNPLHGERRPGTVGQPLPGVEVRLVDAHGAPLADGTPGELEVRGPQVFAEYWGRPSETTQAFRDGWFRTGDMAVTTEGCYRILGRLSTDIIKSGGYKISALEIEELMREHPAVTDCAVIGLPDADLGERVVAAVILRQPSTTDPASLSAWVRERLAAYKAPRDIHVVAELPRNAMGKVVKPALRATFTEGSPGA